jgi:hypothetical protein
MENGRADVLLVVMQIPTRKCGLWGTRLRVGTRLTAGYLRKS